MKNKFPIPCIAALFIGFGSVAPAEAAWEIDPSHTHVSFQVWHLGLSQTPGIFRKVEGRVVYDDRKVEDSTVTLSIDTASIDTVHEARDADLRGPNWFDAKQYPAITFASKGVRRVDDTHYVISGALTIRGKTVPVDFATVLTNRATNPFLKVPMTGFVGTAKIKRSDFGMTQYPAVIGDEVDLKIALELLQKP